MSKLGNCPNCQGHGYYYDHDPNDPHYDGMCHNCPIEEPCSTCNSTGWVRTMKTILLEKFNFRKKFVTFDELDDLPF